MLIQLYPINAHCIIVTEFAIPHLTSHAGREEENEENQYTLVLDPRYIMLPCPLTILRRTYRLFLVHGNKREKNTVIYLGRYRIKYYVDIFNFAIVSF